MMESSITLPKDRNYQIDLKELGIAKHTISLTIGDGNDEINIFIRGKSQAGAMARSLRLVSQQIDQIIAEHE